MNKNIGEFPEKIALDITALDYADYGLLFNLSGSGPDTHNTKHSSGDGWSDVDSAFPILDTLGALGLTEGSGTPFVVREMERHWHTQEAQLPLEQAIVFCMAKPCEPAPTIEDIVPVILRPGFVFVFHRGVWHSSSHGLEGSARYYWQAQVYQNEPTVWRDIVGGPLLIRAADPAAALEQSL